jgi:hypothetical protein
LLLTEKNKISAAEHMIDELVKYILANPTLSDTMTIPGQEIRRANRVQVSNAFNEYANFLVSKVPTTVITMIAQPRTRGTSASADKQAWITSTKNTLPWWIPPKNLA